MEPSNLIVEQTAFIKTRYNTLLDLCKTEYDRGGIAMIRRSLDFLIAKVEEEGKKEELDMFDFSIQFATMVIRELGLDPLGVSAALLLKFAEKAPTRIHEIEKKIGTRIAGIVRELDKIAELDTEAMDKHSENLRNLILSISTDFRVILIKISERLFQMRLLSTKKDEENIRIALEAKAIYSPLAHRLGLYQIMSEMDDIAMFVLETEVYNEINKKLQATKAKREKFIHDFISPLQEKLEKERLKCEIIGRPKSISSIWRKMKKQHVEFEEVYDKFAIRVILNSTPAREKSDCWRAYSLITDIYQPNPDRLRDWISVPKSNGYESLHTTVVVPGGEWVEIQIRTRRMNEIAEKGLAAHWKYKGIKGQAGIDEWLVKVREALDQTDDGSGNVLDDLKVSQFNKEIFVFTPNGDLKKFPENSTVLDFAYDIHTDVGSTCVGAKINGKNVPIRHTLHNGDKVEIIRSKKQKAKVDWLNFVTTSKAKTKIKQTLKEEKLKEAENGKEILRRRFKNWKVEYNDASVRKVIQHFKYRDSIDFHYDIATEKLDVLSIKDIVTEKEEVAGQKAVPIESEQVDRMLKNAVQTSNDILVIDNKIANIDYKLAKCCHPIHGDSVFGFVTRTAGISIHRMNCPNAQQLMTRYGYRVVKAQWNVASDDTRFAVTIIITGIDDLGVVSNITDVISKDLQVNMRSISVDSKDGIFEGNITLFVRDVQHLEALIMKLKKIKGITGVRRID